MIRSCNRHGRGKKALLVHSEAYCIIVVAWLAQAFHFPRRSSRAPDIQRETKSHDLLIHRPGSRPSGLNLECGGVRGNKIMLIAIADVHLASSRPHRSRVEFRRYLAWFVVAPPSPAENQLVFHHAFVMRAYSCTALALLLTPTGSHGNHGARELRSALRASAFRSIHAQRLHLEERCRIKVVAIPVFIVYRG